MWLGSCMVMWPWICETETRNAFPYSDGTHTRWKDCPCFACLFIRMFMVFWRQSTLYKVVNQAANSVNSDLPAFSSVQATSLWSFIPQKGKIALQKTQERGSESPLCDTYSPYLQLFTNKSSFLDNFSTCGVCH